MMLGGCTGEKSGTNSGTGDVVEQKMGGTLRLACVPVDTLNPLKTVHASVADVMSFVYEGLYMTLPDLTVKPVLAKEYKALENNTLYKIRIKDSVKFHDGKKLTAADVVATIDYIKKFGGRYSSVISDVELYWAEGSDVVVLELNKSRADFVNNLDFPVLPAGIGDEVFLGEASFVVNGTGPYCYDSQNEYKNLYFKAYEKWHGSDHRAYIDNIDVSILTDEKTIISAFDVGSVDAVSTSWRDYNDMNLTSSMFNVFECELNKFTFIGINCNSEYFDEADERKALAACIDRESITEDIMIGRAVTAYSPARENVYFNPDETDDKEKNDDAVSSRSSGRGRNSGNKDEKKCTLLYNSDNKTRAMLASAVKSQLEKYGYEVTLDEQDYDSYLAKINGDAYDLYIGEVKTDNSASVSFMFGSARNGRICNYEDSDLGNLVSNLEMMTDAEDKIIAWNNFEKYYEDKVFQIPLYFTDGAVMVNKRIKGKAEPNLSNLYYGFSEMYIENEK